MEDQLQTIQKEYKCVSCAAILSYVPGTTKQVCQYCQAENEFAVSDAAVEEMDFRTFLETADLSKDQVSISTVKCDSCGSETAFQQGVISDNCSFCGSQITIKESAHLIIMPNALLPFKIDKSNSLQLSDKWMKSKWYTPNDLKKMSSTHKLTGVYIPYWTFDAHVVTDYTGQRGEDYTDHETYTTMENGRSVTKTRTVTRTRWWSASGRVSDQFDDMLVLASNSLPPKNTAALEPWDMDQLVPYDEKFLSGFKAEAYQIDLKAGFEIATQQMKDTIEDTIRMDIGGDRQRIDEMESQYFDVTFKHVLLPVWISSFNYKGKIYRLMVNARTGEVQGELPYSFWKIFFVVLACLVVIAGVVLLFAH